MVKARNIIHAVDGFYQSGELQLRLVGGCRCDILLYIIHIPSGAFTNLKIAEIWIHL